MNLYVNVYTKPGGKLICGHTHETMNDAQSKIFSDIAYHHDFDKHWIYVDTCKMEPTCKLMFYMENN